jgi:hypothetical protein
MSKFRKVGHEAPDIERSGLRTQRIINAHYSDPNTKGQHGRER